MKNKTCVGCLKKIGSEEGYYLIAKKERYAKNKPLTVLTRHAHIDCLEID